MFVQKGIKLGADLCHTKHQQQLINLPHSLMFWQAPLGEGFNCLWQASLLRQLCLHFLLFFSSATQGQSTVAFSLPQQAFHTGTILPMSPLFPYCSDGGSSKQFFSTSIKSLPVLFRQFSIGVMITHDFSSRQHWCCQGWLQIQHKWYICDCCCCCCVGGLNSSVVSSNGSFCQALLWQIQLQETICSQKQEASGRTHTVVFSNTPQEPWKHFLASHARWLCWGIHISHTCLHMGN